MNRSWLVVAVLLGSSSSSSSSSAQESGPVPEEASVPPVEGRRDLATEIEELVVSATRREAPLSRSPASVSRVGEEEIRRGRLRRTLPDALSDLPSVMVQRTAYGQASPFLRGFTGYHTVLLIDGVRLNNSTFRSGPNQYWSTVDSYLVEGLEVVRGPASVLYGSDAVGGAVNVVTRRRRDFEPGVHSEARVHARYATAERSWTERAELEANDGDLGILFGGTWRDYGDLRAGDGTGRQPETGYRTRSFDLRVDWRSTDRTAWTFAWQREDQDAVPRTERTVHAVPFEGTTVGSELRRDLFQDRDLVYLRHDTRETGLSWADRIETTLSWHAQREVQERDRTGGRSDRQGVAVGTLGFQTQWEKGTAAGEWTWGVEYWRDGVDSFRTDYRNGVTRGRQIQGPVADDATYDLLGVYAQDEIPVGAGTLTAGARYTYAAARAKRVDDPSVPGSDPRTPGNVLGVSDRWSSVVGSLRALHPLGGGWNAFGGVSQAFRAPNLSDLTRLDATSAVEVPSPGLDPERFVTAEAGLRARTERWSLQAALWRTRIDGLIVPSPTGAFVGATPVVRKDNVGEGWAHGAEVEGSWRAAPAWTVSAAASWMDGEVDQLSPAGREVREPLSRLAPLTGVVTVRFRPPEAPWAAWISGRASRFQDDLSLKDRTDTNRIPPGGTPGYAVLSLGASWEISPAATVSLVLENLLDENHRVHGSGVNEPGRNLVAAVEVAF